MRKNTAHKSRGGLPVAGNLALLLLCTSLVGCGIQDRLFNRDECRDGDCDTPDLLDNRNTNQQWYCYGRVDGSDWDCVNEPDPLRIVAVAPKTTAPIPSRLGQPLEQRINTTPSAAGRRSRASNASASAVVPGTPSASGSSLPREVAPPASAAATGDAAMILLQPAEFFTVQLIALQDEGALLEYAAENDVADPVYVPVLSQNAPWYVLLLGVYPDRRSAETAKNAWENLKQRPVRPWIRQLGALQEAVRAMADQAQATSSADPAASGTR